MAPISVEAEIAAALLAIESGKACADDVESITLDFKEDHPQRPRKENMTNVADCATCLANRHGGAVVVGIADKIVGPGAFKGTLIEEEVLRAHISAKTTPHLKADVRAITRQNVRLLIVTVPTDDVYQIEGRAPQRQYKGCENMTTAEIARLRSERLGIDWTSEASQVTVDDLDPNAATAALRAFLESESAKTTRSALLAMLRKLGAIRQDGHLTNAGQLLLCQRAHDRGPHVIYQYRPARGAEPSNIEHIHDPLIVAFRRVMDLVRARQVVSHIPAPSGGYLTLEHLSLRAVQEALSNALIHRDYLMADPVSIEHSPDEFRIVSPGPFVSGVDRRNIITVSSKPRYASLAYAARQLKMIQHAGQGIDRMFSEVLRTGNAPPSIDESPTSVEVVIPGGRPLDALVRFIISLPAHGQDDTNLLLVLHYLRHNRTITAATASSLIQRPETRAKEILHDLTGTPLRLLEPTRETSRMTLPTYRLTETVKQALGSVVDYYTSMPPDLDEKVIRHVKLYRHINNETIREYFRVDVYRARDLLGDLQVRRIIKKTSTQSRGPMVKYGPGEAFPADSKSPPAPVTVAGPSDRGQTSLFPLLDIKDK